MCGIRVEKMSCYVFSANYEVTNSFCLRETKSWLVHLFFRGCWRSWTLRWSSEQSFHRPFKVFKMRVSFDDAISYA